MNEQRIGQVPYTAEQVTVRFCLILFKFLQTIEAYYRLFPCCAFIVAGSIAAVGMNIIKKQPDENSQRLVRLVYSREHIPSLGS